MRYPVDYLDGFMGISPGYTTDNFMNQIYTAFNSIENNLFSIFIKNNKDGSTLSTMTIGRYNT